MAAAAKQRIMGDLKGLQKEKWVRIDVRSGLPDCKAPLLYLLRCLTGIPHRPMTRTFSGGTLPSWSSTPTVRSTVAISRCVCLASTETNFPLAIGTNTRADFSLRLR